MELPISRIPCPVKEGVPCMVKSGSCRVTAGPEPLKGHLTDRDLGARAP